MCDETQKWCHSFTNRRHKTAPNVIEHTKIYEPRHDKTNEMTRASSEDSDQPGHLPSLIRDIPNNGLLVRAITDILFYSDLIGTMIEIN